MNRKDVKEVEESEEEQKQEETKRREEERESIECFSTKTQRHVQGTDGTAR